METWVNVDGFTEVQAKLDALVDPDVGQILLGLQQVIFLQNRDGLLEGTDRDGAPMVATVREQTPEGHWVSYHLPDGRLAKYYQAGRSGDRYEDGDGRPLNPHGLASRAITNLQTFAEERGPNEWAAVGEWIGVESRNGVEFLPFHFEGAGRLPVRNLAGVRPDGWERAVALVDSWAAALIAGEQWQPFGGP